MISEDNIIPQNQFEQDLGLQITQILESLTSSVDMSQLQETRTRNYLET